MKRFGQIVLPVGLLLVFLVLSLLPEAQAATNIPSVSVTLTVPVAGARPDYNPGLPSGAPTYYSENYNSENYANDMAWRDLTSGDIYLPVTTGTFEVGHKYRVNIFLTPVDGYAFTSSTTATVNGASADVLLVGNELKVMYTFPTVTAPKPTITTQPASATVYEGAIANFFVAADNAETYQWYYMKPGESTWNQVSSNGTSAIYSLVTAARHNGYTYRCKVTNAGGSVYSSTVTLTVAAGVKITAQPKSVTVAKAGDTARTTVTAMGDGLTYQWYVKDPGSSSFTKSSNTTKSYSVVLTAAKSGRQVYCVVGDKYGNTVKSSTATLSIAK